MFKRGLLSIVASLAWGVSAAFAGPSLIPDGPNRSPDYFCTWNVQGYVCSYASGDAQRAAMNEANLLGRNGSPGWVDLYPAIRHDLFFVLDDSWDIPLNGDSKQFGSLMVNEERFPSFTGSPTQRLRTLTDRVKAKGWRGLGGWVCAQQAPARAIADEDAYWAERLQWMNDAGFAYWKVDWGKHEKDAAWREKLTALAAKTAPKLIVEHALVEGSLASAAVYRTYDVENIIAAPDTIARVAHLLKTAPKNSPTIVNCEDEPYVAAGLGCAIGVMRHAGVGALPNGHQDFVFPPVGRDLKHRLDEIARAVRWHRIADPLPLSDQRDAIDEATLADSWTLAADETYTPFKPGDHRNAAAPARIARGGLPLPIVEVEKDQLVPFVLATRSPNGAVAIATIGRTQDRAYITPRACITQDVGTATTLGIFGNYERLTLRFDQPLGKTRILAQDLAGDVSEDITDQVTIYGSSLTLSGELISKIGLSAKTRDDVSEPGLLIVLKEDR